MAGEPYDGGGIGVSVAATRAASDDELRRCSVRVAEMRALGTTTVEVKSGYGLTVDDEERSLRLAREVTEETTFLGAHVVPPEARGDRAAYLDLVTGPMLAACAPHARWVDVFCEPAAPLAFTEDEARRVLLPGGMPGSGCACTGTSSGGPGVRLAVELGAASVDHCTHLTAPTSRRWSAAARPWRPCCPAWSSPPARRTRTPGGPRRGGRRRAGDRLQPGHVQHGIHAVRYRARGREMRMTAAEALVAATVGGARALRRTDVGRVAVGSRADLAVLEAPSYEHLAYRPGMPLARALDLG